VRGKVELRGRGRKARGKVVCTLPTLSWAGELVDPVAEGEPDDAAEEEDVEDVEDEVGDGLAEDA
jgi:hypothetical protein